MRKGNLLILLAIGAFSVVTLNAQTFQNESGDYRLIGERSDQFTSGALNPWDSAQYIYNASNHALEKVYKLSYSTATSSWDTVTKEDYTYSGNATSKQVVQVISSKISNVWNLANRITKQYNLTGGLISELNEFYVVASTSFVNSSKLENTYDGNSRLIKELYSNWDATNSVWISGSDIRTTYFGNTNKSDSIINYTNNVPTSGRNNVYNTQDQIILTNNLIFDPMTSLPVVNGKTEYTYNSGNLVSEDNYTYDAGGDSLFIINSYSYTFNSNKIATELLKTRNSASSPLVDNNRKTISYDANNNPDSVVDENYDAANSQWINNQTISYDFNAGNYKTYEMYELWIAINTAYRVNIERFKHYELRPNISVHNPSITKLSLFPNPTSTLLNINYGVDEKVNFYVYSLDGKVVKSGLFLAQNNELNVFDLNSGVYVLKLAGTTINGSYRFVKM